MPKALYSLCRADDAPNPNPVMVTDKLAMQTSRQTTHRLLCTRCEQLLSERGENWTIPQLASYGGRFPFGETLKKLKPLDTLPGDLAYSLEAVGEVHADDLTHFAMGIFWKSSVHSWDKRRTEPLISLGKHEENVRRFVAGEGPFPSDIALTVMVQPMPVKQISFVFPATTDGSVSQFYVPGIQFMLWLGPAVPLEIRLASFHAKPRFVLVLDVESYVREKFVDVYSRAYKRSDFLATLPKPPPPK